MYLCGPPKRELHLPVLTSVLPMGMREGMFSLALSCLGSVAVPSVAQVRWRFASCIS